MTQKKAIMQANGKNNNRFDAHKNQTSKQPFFNTKVTIKIFAIPLLVFCVLLAFSNYSFADVFKAVIVLALSFVASELATRLLSNKQKINNNCIVKK